MGNYRELKRQLKKIDNELKVIDRRFEGGVDEIMAEHLVTAQYGLQEARESIINELNDIMIARFAIGSGIMFVLIILGAILGIILK